MHEISHFPEEHPAHWFKDIYPYFEKYLSKTKKNTYEDIFQFSENETKKG